MQFVFTLEHYIIEILPALVLGFFLSGLIHESIPTRWIENHLGRKGTKPILYSTIAGTILPVCCLGALPIAVSFHKKGAGLGPVLAFLVATPATSITALMVTYRLLGVRFAVYLFLSVILMGIIMGVIGNKVRISRKSLEEALDPICKMSVIKENAFRENYMGENHYFCSPHCAEIFIKNPTKYVERVKTFRDRIVAMLKFSFVDMVKEIGPELAIGLVLAAIVATFTPIGNLIGNYLSGTIAYGFAIGFGLIVYICSTASVPLVHAFLLQGMNIGAGLVLLLAGPITSYGTILVLRKEFGGKILMLYLILICIIALVLGYFFSLMVM